jgi:hypothetical protein
MRTIAIAPRPGGVAMAAIVSSKPLILGYGRRPRSYYFFG